MPFRAFGPTTAGDRAKHYVLACAIAGAATLSRFLVDPLVGDQIPYFIYVAAVVVATWSAGTDGGILCTVVSAFAGNYFFVPPRYEFIPHGEDWVAMGLFSLVAFGLVALVGRWGRAEEALRQQAEQLTVLHEEAERANRVKDEFLATLSHELRSPLSAIVGWSSMLKKRRLPAEIVERAIDVIHRSANAQTHLIDDVLDVARIVNRKLRLEMQLLDLGAALQAAIEVIRPEADAKKVAISACLTNAPSTVFGDSARLQQVFSNLLSNAVKFTEPGGQVAVSMERVDAFVQVQVQDSGIGISPELLPHIFERFRQRDSSSTRAHTGLGLGLAIVQHLVEAHGGTVAAHSAGEGKGATFVVRLPFEAQDRRMSTELLPPAPVMAAADHEPSLGGLTVFVVDDHAEARETTSSILQHAGATVLCAASGLEALKHLPLVNPGVLLIDLAMPGMDGYALLREIQQSGRRPRIPAIALTAYARSEDRERALASGFQMHIAKPVESDTLVRAVARLWAEHQLI
jgi:signal transduction histidine kinase/ActR/RegA family two-component response regulator